MYLVEVVVIRRAAVVEATRTPKKYIYNKQCSVYYERELERVHVPGRGGGDQESYSSRGNKELLKNIINSVVCNERVLGVVWFRSAC